MGKTPENGATVSLNFLYQLIGREVVEKAVLAEQLVSLQREVAAIRAQLEGAP